MSTLTSRTRGALDQYFSKWAGEVNAGPGKFSESLFVLITTLGGFAALGIVSAACELAQEDASQWIVMVGSFGATVVLVFGAPAGPFSQPRNIIGGNIIASLVGVGCRVWIAAPMGNYSFALPFAVSLSYVLMQLTRTVNPPAGGTAALVVISTPAIDRIGWGLIVPATLWGIVFVFIACLFINLVPGHRYPRYWFVDHQVYQKIADKCCCCCCSAKLQEIIKDPPLNEPDENACEIHSTTLFKHQPANASVPNRDDEGNVTGPMDEGGDIEQGKQSFPPQVLTDEGRSKSSTQATVPPIAVNPVVVT